jgi:transposase, IS5 family
MLIDRYPAVDLFELVPKRLMDFEPELRELDRLLDDDVLFQRIKADLGRRRPHSLSRGRHSTPVEVILRLLVVKRLYQWSYEQTEHFVGDSLVLRQFCRVYLQPVPDDTTVLRWAALIGPQTLECLNERVIELARSLKVTRGRKLRVDSTVVETPIHHPTDSRLVGDGVRVLSRLLRRAKTILGGVPGLSRRALEGHTRSVRRLAQQVHRLARRKGEEAAEQMRSAYQRLAALGQQTCAQAARARRALAALADQPESAAQRLRAQIDQVLPLVQQAIDQAVRRVLRGESVSAKEKIVSLFEPHTQIIQRHKAGKPVEFGRKLWLEEVDGGLVSGYRVLPEAGQDHAYLAESLADHQRRFGHPPWLLTGDRGVSSPTNEVVAQQAGVKRIALPANGKVSAARQAYERTPQFRRAYRFRAGVEGRIRVLQRDFGLDRCPDHGEDGMGRWVGWGVLTHNLAKIAQTVARRTVARRTAARRPARPAGKAA